MTRTSRLVTPAKAGVQTDPATRLDHGLDASIRWHDVLGCHYA